MGRFNIRQKASKSIDPKFSTTSLESSGTRDSVLDGVFQAKENERAISRLGDHFFSSLQAKADASKNVQYGAQLQLAADTKAQAIQAKRIGSNASGKLASVGGQGIVQGYFIGHANAGSTNSMSYGQDRQADHSFRDPANLANLATSNVDVSLANSLKISEDGKLAVENVSNARQAKVFYAQSSIVDKSNKILAKQGSKYLLHVKSAGAINVNDVKGKVHTLDAIEPIINPDKGTKSKMSKINPKLDLTKAGDGATFEATCVAVAEAILNKSYGKTAKLDISKSKVGLDSPLEQSQWSSCVADAIGNGGSRKKGKAINQNTIAKAYGLLVAQNPDAAKKLAKKLNVNQFAQAKVGEAYVTESVGMPTPTGITNWLLDSTGATNTDLMTDDATVRGGKRRTGWGNHVGAVVAESSGNTVTLENYARSGEDPALVDNDNIYYFAMYGPAISGQSWHDVWTGGATPIANGVTGVLKPK